MEQDFQKKDDSALVEILQETSNQKAFEALYNRYKERLARKIFSLLGNYHDTRDIEQEIWIKVAQKITSFERKSAFYTWLYAIASNVCINEIKKRNRKREIFRETAEEEGQNGDEWGRNEHIIDEKTPLEKLITGERVQFLRIALKHLSDDHLTVVIMYYFQGIPHAEIAKHMQCSEGTVRSRLHYALRHLNTFITKME